MKEVSYKNSFRFRIIALCGAILGGFLIPYIPIQLNPESKSFTINIGFNYPNADALLIENEVTSRFEQAFSRLEHLEEITSLSKEGIGSIQLIFNQYAEIEKKRLEISSLIRQIHTHFKDKISFPELSYESRFDNKRHLLTFTLISNHSTESLEEFIQKQLIYPLSLIQGVHRFELSGLEKKKWQIVFQEDQLQQLGITYEQIADLIKNHFKILDLGWTISPIDKTIYAKFGNSTYAESFPQKIKNIGLSNKNGRIIYLKDIASITKVPVKPNHYYRINGQTGVSLLVYSENSTNQISLAKKIKEKVEILKPSLKGDLDILLQHDSTSFLNEELLKIIYRISASLLILFLLIIFIYPRSYFKLVFIGFILSLFWSFIIYFLSGLQLHLYSMAGLTLSLGIILDNIIIMTDHLAKKKDKKIILALLAANLTTIGVFTVIFLIEEKYREELTDFILIFSINLLISLGVVIWFLAAFQPSKLISNKKALLKNWKTRLTIKINKFYKNYISFTQKRKPIFYSILLLLFGLPFFSLPDEIKSNALAAEFYNKTIGSEFYQENLDPILDKYLSGTMGLFVRSKIDYLFNGQKQEQTKLYVKASLPYGSTIEQMNEVMKELEQFLIPFPGVAKFQTFVNGYEDGQIEIEFTEEAEKTGFPLQLRGKVETRGDDIGSATFRVYGIGPGFSNAVSTGRISQHLKLSGYNYQKLKEIAEKERLKLLEHMRINEVLISSQINWSVPQEKYFVLNFSNPGLMLRENLDLIRVGNKILNLDQQKEQINLSNREGKIFPIQLLSNKPRQNYFWESRENPVLKDSLGFFKVKNLTNIETVRGVDDVVRKNQEYQLYLEYEFLGAHFLANEHKEEKIKEAIQTLPVGFRIEDENFGWWNENFGKKLPLLIVMAILTIFVFCAILFNSIKWSLIPLTMVPLSFIGIFISVYLFKFEFDQGGLAAFLLVAGLSVNGAILIINDYLILKKKYFKIAPLHLFLKAFRGKIVPIFLTSVSTCLGLLPFLIFDVGQPFWYALAICTISGILFSMVVLTLFLPIFFNLHIRIKRLDKN